MVHHCRMKLPQTPPTQQVNFALIGCGRIANRHIEAINATPEARLIAVCDTNLPAAQEKAASLSVPAYDQYHVMLGQHPEIDVVILLTPSGLHFEQAMDILARNPKHLLIEKPMVMTLAQADALQQAAKQAGCEIFPVYQNRFNKAVRRVKRAMQDGAELGAVRVGTVRVRWCREQAYYDLSAWRGTWAMDGGALTNQGVHYIDLLRYLCGDVKRVHAKTAALGVNIEADDTAVAILEFTNGALGVIEVMTSARPHDFEASISCVCERGVAVIGGIAANVLQTFSPDPAQEPLNSENFSSVYGFGHEEVMRGVVDKLLYQKLFPVSYPDGVETLRVLHALYRSDELDGWVNVQQAGDSNRLGRNISR